MPKEWATSGRARSTWRWSRRGLRRGRPGEEWTAVTAPSSAFALSTSLERRWFLHLPPPKIVD